MTGAYIVEVKDRKKGQTLTIIQEEQTWDIRDRHLLF